MDTAAENDRTEFDELVQLEHDGWRSLCNSTGGEFYGSNMTDQARMVLADGSIMSRSDVVDALEHAPPWASYTITDPALTVLDEDVRALVYTGTGHRHEGDDFTGIMTSIYVRTESGWRLAHYQQTPVP